MNRLVPINYSSTITNSPQILHDTFEGGTIHTNGDKIAVNFTGNTSIFQISNTDTNGNITPSFNIKTSTNNATNFTSQPILTANGSNLAPNGVLASIVPGNGVNIDNTTQPGNIIINTSGGGGGIQPNNSNLQTTDGSGNSKLNYLISSDNSITIDNSTTPGITDIKAVSGGGIGNANNSNLIESNNILPIINTDGQINIVVQPVADVGDAVTINIGEHVITNKFTLNPNLLWGDLSVLRGLTSVDGSIILTQDDTAKTLDLSINTNPTASAAMAMFKAMSDALNDPANKTGANQTIVQEFLNDLNKFQPGAVNIS